MEAQVTSNGLENGASRLSASQKPCTHCRRRKVRCDKLRPCSNCGRSGIECIYDGVPQQNELNVLRSTTSTAELQNRIARLEGLIENMAGVNLSGSSPSEYPAMVAGAKNQDPAPSAVQAPKVPLGKQIFRIGICAYTDPSTWISLYDQVEQFRFYLNTWGAQSKRGLPPASSFVFGIKPLGAPIDVEQGPSFKQSEMLCKVFFESVDPFMKILHRPTFDKELAQYWRKSHAFQNEFGLLVSSVHAVSVAVLRSEVVVSMFGEPRDVLLDRYQLVVESALARTNILQTRNVESYQGLLYYIALLYLRGYYDDACTMVGLAVRISQRLGMHRDPANFSFSPWIVEMRRRMWNHVRYLDSLGLELTATEPGTEAVQFDTKAPKNVNDNDWEACRFAKRSSEPVAADGFSELSYVLLRREVSALMREVCKMQDPDEFEEYQSLIRQKREEIESRFLQHFNQNHRIQNFIASVTRMKLAYIDMVNRQAYIRYGEATTELRSETFYQAVEILEEIERIEKEFANEHWEWVVHEFVPWHAVAIVLVTLCCWMEGTWSERAWRQIEVFFTRYDNVDSDLAQSPLFNPLQQLRDRALFKRNSIDVLDEPENAILSAPQQMPIDTMMPMSDLSMLDLEGGNEYIHFYSEDPFGVFG